MLGAAGALCCVAAGTALGGWLRTRRAARLELICSALEVLAVMRLMLETERPALPELLESCAAHAGTGEGAQVIGSRLLHAARLMRTEPMTGVGQAYAQASKHYPAVWEKAEEKAALDSLFVQLGSGTAAMREQAAAGCIRRLKPLCEKARTEAEKGGKLCMQLGMLLGLMAGIALW